jgi:hypothetical protein
LTRFGFRSVLGTGKRMNFENAKVFGQLSEEVKEKINEELSKLSDLNGNVRMVEIVWSDSPTAARIHVDSSLVYMVRTSAGKWEIVAVWSTTH